MNESNAFQLVRKLLTEIIQSQFKLELNEKELQLQTTRKEFEGDVTWVIFPLAKKMGKNPEALGNEIGVGM
ncbi:MAG: arginine--tRNA ligase, partial [Bacteroidota bacterium]